MYGISIGRYFDELQTSLIQHLSHQSIALWAIQEAKDIMGYHAKWTPDKIALQSCMIPSRKRLQSRCLKEQRDALVHHLQTGSSFPSTGQILLGRNR